MHKLRVNCVFTSDHLSVLSWCFRFTTHLLLAVVSLNETHERVPPSFWRISVSTVAQPHVDNARAAAWIFGYLGIGLCFESVTDRVRQKNNLLHERFQKGPETFQQRGFPRSHGGVGV